MAKETFRDIYSSPDRATPAAASSTGTPSSSPTTWLSLTSFAGTIRQWENQFLNYFGTRATNAKSEARNLIIKQVKGGGFGFRRSTTTASAFCTGAGETLAAQSPEC